MQWKKSIQLGKLCDIGIVIDSEILESLSTA
jgi:hypothetical protein